ncbi:uncharacterized protein LOC133844889 [Drosophila sulfurigaster albostrigata]|uniref:uncharacterized protein LOC133844889 n=1 Tax=Drosophila sulfurigaster albostrigata TaxID=89887 RepID=UPI002D21AA30|nr:uncharacterized protein LOC133844889 [Drosophila sulfurigaster albostrigata]
MSCNWDKRNGRDTLSYALFLHRQELQRPKRFRRLMAIANTKLKLTDELIRLQRCQWKWQAPSEQQLNALQREREYRDILKHNMQQHQLKQQRKRRQCLEAKFGRNSRQQTRF